jgi:hypothetical protein
VFNELHVTLAVVVNELQLTLAVVVNELQLTLAVVVNDLQLTSPTELIVRMLLLLSCRFIPPGFPT